MPNSPAESAQHADEIAAALARVRGRRMPRPPWAKEGPARHAEHDHTGRGHPHSRGRGLGGPPWADGAGRFGGPARMRLLEALAAASHPLTIGEIAEAVSVDQPRASRLVQQGVEHELVRREIDPHDARRSRVALTERGRRVVQDFTGNRREAIDSALSTFTDAERADLARLLTKLADGWPQS
ncbi:MarR family winged helix-turn-helix transcriptional regulator [Microbacterium marmarense]|uniref:MarR family winged helix-turn-helix transcriptional regulator n=1 Tax=Microbacterium marmarense TaxID=3122051 RepID=A0ABU8LPF3_9MICO